MIQIIIAGLLYIIASASLIFFTDINVILKVTIPIIYISVVLLAYVTGYTRGIIDIRTGLKGMVDDDVASLKAELERLSQGVDSELL
jgi:hypothetical protein